jgi:hypothetical protein
MCLIQTVWRTRPFQVWSHGPWYPREMGPTGITTPIVQMGILSPQSHSVMAREKHGQIADYSGCGGYKPSCWLASPPSLHMPSLSMSSSVGKDGDRWKGRGRHRRWGLVGSGGRGVVQVGEGEGRGPSSIATSSCGSHSLSAPTPDRWREGESWCQEAVTAGGQSRGRVLCSQGLCGEGEAAGGPAAGPPQSQRSRSC